MIDDKPLFNGKLDDLLDECVPGGALKYLSPKDYISNQQIRWFKGCLLPALSKDSGDTIDWWETTLKLAVLPDEFAPETITVKGKEYCRIPSITKLSVKKMNILIEGSVAYCHEIGMMWVTLPDSKLRSAA